MYRAWLHFISDIWHCWCLLERNLFSRRCHELFLHDFNSNETLRASFRSIIATSHPLDCYKEVSSTVFVHVGVDRVVILQLLELMGAKFHQRIDQMQYPSYFIESFCNGIRQSQRMEYFNRECPMDHAKCISAASCGYSFASFFKSWTIKALNIPLFKRLP